jgi:hypothetical protein
MRDVTLVETFDALPFLKRVDANLPVWELRSSFFQLKPRASNADQLHVLHLLRGAFSALQTVVCYSENPIEDGIGGHWEQMATDTWRVPSTVTLESLLNWLYLGNWVMYSGPELVEASLLSAIHSAPSGRRAVEIVTRFNMDFIIASFHDDALWTIALQA